MADYSVPTEAGAFELQFWRLAGQLRVCMPGNIVSFDAATQRCVAQPGIKMKTVIRGVASYLDLPEVQNVPIVVPYAQGAGLLLSLPIQSGDPCLLLFSDRALDNYLQTGAAEIPGTATDADVTAPRVHHLTDAICIPGMIANNVVVSDWSTENIELRDKERKNYISLGPNGIEISDGTATWSMSGGAINIVAPGGTTTTSPTNTTEGTISATELKQGNTTFSSHTHSGVQSGMDNSGAPNTGS